VLDAKLRPGAAHTAEGGLDFILPLIDEVEKKLCRAASVRIDAGFPEDELLSALEEREVGYMARIKNNPVLASAVRRGGRRRRAAPGSSR
jgi:hypothetical protein